MCESLPNDKPRFLPLLNGSPVELLHAVFNGVDVIETDYPTEMGRAGFAFMFDPDVSIDSLREEIKKMSAEEKQAKLVEYFTSAPAPVVPAAKAGPPPKKKGKAGQAPKLKPAVEGFHNVQVLDCAGDSCAGVVHPISEKSFVKQYSRAYIHHMYQCGELLGTMLVSMHNIHMYHRLLEACRRHLEEGTFLDFALVFMESQTDACKKA